MMRVLPLVLVLSIASAAGAQTQGDGARMYWKTLAGANAVTFWPILATGNANPIDPAHTVSPGAEFNAMVALLGAHKVLPIGGRSSTLSAFLPVGHMTGTLTDLASEQSQSSRGFGDPILQLTVNLAGAPALMSLAQATRYQPRFTVDLLGAIAFPIGEFSEDQAVNLSQNRWYGRIGAPVVIALAPWVPGKRTTAEVLPALWLFQDVEKGAGRVLKNAALFQLEGHLTRDLTDTFWGSIDTSWFHGAKPDLSGPGGLKTLDGKALNNSGIGFTLGFQVNQNLSINTSYFSTVADSGTDDLKADEFRVMFTYGWHKLVEGMKRLGDK